MDIKELFGYKGKNVVITGSASGMSYDATESWEQMYMQLISTKLHYL